jgi:hypothetical protein
MQKRQSFEFIIFGILPAEAPLMPSLGQQLLVKIHGRSPLFCPGIFRMDTSNHRRMPAMPESTGAQTVPRLARIVCDFSFGRFRCVIRNARLAAWQSR